MNLQGKTAVVTGGSRGLGLGVVEALVERGAEVTVVARDPGRLDSVASRLPVRTVTADIRDAEAARRVIGQVRPAVLILNAGARPAGGPLDTLGWEAFSAPWDTDVKAGLVWMQAALALPLDPGSRVIVSASGAAISGSPLSGGYAGAKRMLWLMANYASGIAQEKSLGIRFQSVSLNQMVGGTGVGDTGLDAYAGRAGLSHAEFITRFFGAPLDPRGYGEMVAAILEDAQYEAPRAFRLRGDTGVTVLEDQPA